MGRSVSRMLPVQIRVPPHLHAEPEVRGVRAREVLRLGELVVPRHRTAVLRAALRGDDRRQLGERHSSHSPPPLPRRLGNPRNQSSLAPVLNLGEDEVHLNRGEGALVLEASLAAELGPHVTVHGVQLSGAARAPKVGEREEGAAEGGEPPLPPRDAISGSESESSGRFSNAMSPSDDLSFDGDRGGDVSQGRRPEGRNRCWLARGKTWPRKRIVKIRAGERAARRSGAVRRRTVVIGCSVRLVHEVVETTELLARGLARLRRGRHCPAREGFSPPALCWRGDRNYVIASRGAPGN